MTAFTEKQLPPPLHLMGGRYSAPAPPKSIRHIWIVIGPAGCGKSTIAQFLANKLNLPYIEGDDFHPYQNVAKMASGIALTDEDRWGWLATLRNEAVAKLAAGAAGCIVTCSCLKRRYRDVIRLAGLEVEGDVALRFVYLRADEGLVLDRVRARKGHYMKDAMVRGQFAALEEPATDEGDVVTVDGSGARSDVQWLALESVLQRMDAEGRAAWRG